MYIIQTISDADCLGVAQLVERLTVHQNVAGSSPATQAIRILVVIWKTGRVV